MAIADTLASEAGSPGLAGERGIRHAEHVREARMAGAKIESLTANPAAEAGRFVDAAERDALAGRALRITGMIHDGRNRFGPRWLVSVVDLATGEKLAVGLADNDARNAMYPDIAATLDDDGPLGIEPVALYRQTPAKGGNPFWTFRSATDAEIAAAEADGALDDAAADAEGEAEGEAEAPILTPAKTHRARA
jgi:hypothetical protein